MSTQTDNDTATSTSDRRLKPHQLSLGLGIGMGAFILVSGVLPQITGWKNDNAVHRTVFVNIPGPLQIAFYTVIPVMVVWGAFRFADRMRNWERGAPAKRRTTTKNVKRRAADFRAGVYMRTLLRDSAAGLMHSMIYFGFLVLMGVTTVLEIDHQMPESLKFLHGGTYKAYAFVGDFAGVEDGLDSSFSEPYISAALVAGRPSDREEGFHIPVTVTAACDPLSTDLSEKLHPAGQDVKTLRSLEGHG